MSQVPAAEQPANTAPVPAIPFALPMSHHSFCVWPILFPKPVSNHYCKQHPPVTAAASIADQQPSMFMTMATPNNATVLVAYQQKQFCSVQQEPPIIATVSVADQQPSMVLLCPSGGTAPFYHCYLSALLYPLLISNHPLP